MKSGSFESLNVSTRWGCRVKARQIRLTAVWLSPQRFAIARVLQCVASGGVVSSVSRTTRSTAASLIWRGAPGRGSSSRPSTRLVTKRLRQRPTVWRVTPTSRATASLVCPAAQLNTMRARCATACAVFGRRAQRAKVSRSSAVRTNGGFGRPVRMGRPPFYRENAPAVYLVP